jgi:hypothetical protein
MEFAGGSRSPRPDCLGSDGFDQAAPLQVVAAAKQLIAIQSSLESSSS